LEKLMGDAGEDRSRGGKGGLLDNLK